MQRGKEAGEQTSSSAPQPLCPLAPLLLCWPLITTTEISRLSLHFAWHSTYEMNRIAGLIEGGHKWQAKKNPQETF